MKALTLWQPWASLVACGAKRFETRRWSTDYRGPLAIHAAARPVEMWRMGAAWLALVGQTLNPKASWVEARNELRHLPYGKIVATCILDAVASTDLIEIPALGTLEREFGDWSAGRFTWRLKDVQPVDPPIPWRGRQRLWNLPDDWRERG